jgi:peroxiredoxin
MIARLLTAGAGLALLTTAALPAAAAKPAVKPAAKKPAAGKQDPAAILARLKKDEARVTGGRLSLLVISRQGELPEGARGEAAWEAGRKLSVSAQTREYFVHSGSSWRRDITVMDATGNVTNHFLLGIRGKEPRILQETGHGDQAQRNGTIGLEPQQNAADRLLLSRGADLLEEIVWKTATQKGPQLVLTGTRGGERLTMHLRTTPAYAIERLVSEETVVTPVGKLARGQELVATYNVEKGLLAPKTVQHLIYIGAPRNQVIHASYKVEGAQLNAPIPPDELAVAFPQGTAVTDRRVDPPARYQQGERDLTLAELKAVQEQQGGTTARVGKPSPAWSAKTLDGKTAKLADYRGRVVVMTWFASWCGPCQAEAPRMEKQIWGKYRDKGLTVLGVNASEREDPTKMATAFVKEHGLTYPVLMDTDEALSTAFEIEVLPTLAILDRKGVVRYIQRGFREEEVIALVEKLLAEE